MIFIDFETKSEADLEKVGQWQYACHPSTEIICLCYAIDDGPVQDWWPGHPDSDPELVIPNDLYMAIMLGHDVEAHNAAFERCIWEHIMVNRLGTVEICAHQWRDLMATACYYALPASLDKLSRALGLGGKDPDGTRLISKYCKLYLKTAVREIPPEDFDRFLRYCQKDVELERQISNYLGDLPDEELEVFKLESEINYRGIYLDEKGIEDAIVIVSQKEEEYTEEFRRLVGLNPTQREKVLVWFNRQGLPLENMQKGYLEEVLDEWELPPGPVRRALELRLFLNKASTKKLDAMLRHRGDDGRARFQMRYHGAVTGRPTGSGFQPLNLKRSIEDLNPAQLVRDISYRDPAWLEMLYGDAISAVSSAMRHWIAADKGRRIIAGDFVSIEAVLLACLAGEEWKIEAFRDKAPIYEIMGAEIHNLPQTAVDLAYRDKKAFKLKYGDERQDGKTGELAFGYQGALGAWLKFDNSGRHSDDEIIRICKAWREKHPAIKAFWTGLQEAEIEAVSHPGRTTGYREIGFQIVDEWLSMILPDGKRIWYRGPEIRVGMPHWHQPETKPECAEGSCRCEPVPKVSYMAMKTGQYKRVYSYGGLRAENATQAVARQILVAAAKRAAKYGYNIVLTVYDEIVAEVENGFGSTQEFEEIMTGPLEQFAAGWPIRVDVWEGLRFKK